MHVHATRAWKGFTASDIPGRISTGQHPGALQGLLSAPAAYGSDPECTECPPNRNLLTCGRGMATDLEGTADIDIDGRSNASGHLGDSPQANAGRGAPPAHVWAAHA